MFQNFKFHTTPRKHQLAALEKLGDKPVFGLFMDMGTGKTFTAISVMAARYLQGQSQHVIVVSKSGVQKQWVEDEIPKHINRDVKYKTLLFNTKASFEKEYATFKEFDGLKVLAINIEAVSTPKGEKTLTDFLKLAKGSGSIYLDESQTIKTISAKRSRAMHRLGKLSRYRMILTGTPISKNVVDLYSQLQFLDKNILGLTRVADFVERYCVVAYTPFAVEIIGQKNVDDLQARMEPYIFRITSDEALDLPPKLFVPRKFEMSDVQKRMIREVKSEYRAQLAEKEFNATHAASALTLIQQISCGFAPTDNGEFHELPNPRLEALLDILEQRQGKAIIWCRFNHDIENVCKKLGEASVHYYGKTSAADRETALRLFMSPESDVKYLVANPEAAGTGLNLQGVCNTNVYYSNSFNALSRWQSEGRTWRDGTIGSVTYFDLVAEGSPDSRILNNLRDKKSVSDFTLDDFRRLME